MGKRTSKRGAPADWEARLEGVAAAFDRGAHQEALAGADALLAEDDSLPEALHWRAAALTELGRLDEALETYSRALKLAPDDVELLLSATECLVGRVGDDREAVEDGLALCARGRKLAQRAGDTELLFEFLLWEGI
ncbi:MAG TPA: tetratricopeptide repeat protein, partial [Cystobacter sp.]